MKDAHSYFKRAAALIYTLVLTAIFVFIEDPQGYTVLDWTLYLVSRICLSVVIQWGALVVYHSHPRGIYLTSLEEFSDRELKIIEPLPDTFEQLTIRSLIMLDGIWAREHLLQSPIMYSRLVSIDHEVKELKRSYSYWTAEYTEILTQTFLAYDPAKAHRFINVYKNNVNNLYKEVENLRRHPFLLLSKRREVIMQAFFNFYKNMQNEEHKIKETAYAMDYHS